MNVSYLERIQLGNSFPHKVLAIAQMDLILMASAECIALCRIEANPDPYVTWKVDSAGNCFLGHYFRTLEEAKTDFIQRAYLHPITE